MQAIRFVVDKKKNYTVIDNTHLKEKEMSLQAKGLLDLILSLPEDWDYSINGLSAICKEGSQTIRKILKELQQFGYLEIKKVLPAKRQEGGTGTYTYQYIVHEIPKKVEIPTNKQGI